MTVEIHKSPLKKTTAGQEKQEHIFEIKFIHNKNMRETEITRSLNILKRTPSIPIKSIHFIESFPKTQLF